MTDYNIYFTDKSSKPITIPESDTAKVSGITMFGRINEEYGEDLDQDYLNLLENFACPEVEGNDNIRTSVPDLTKTSEDQLINPVEGQIWYNSTRQTPYYWNVNTWVPIGLREDLAANWGRIMHGEQLPKPKSSLTGRVFDYNDCIWNISPAVIVGKPGYISCSTDDTSKVDMRYRLVGNNVMMEGMVNYLIIGVRGNDNFGQRVTPIAITPTPTPTPTPSTTMTSTPPVTPSNTPSNTPPSTPASTPLGTPAPSASPTAPATPPPSATSTPRPTPPGTPPATPQPRPSYVLTDTQCTFHPNSEVIYGCPEEPLWNECMTAADIGKVTYTTSDCYRGNGMERCLRTYRCQL